MGYLYHFILIYAPSSDFSTSSCTSFPSVRLPTPPKLVDAILERSLITLVQISQSSDQFDLAILVFTIRSKRKSGGTDLCYIIKTGENCLCVLRGAVCLIILIDIICSVVLSGGAK